MSWKRGIKARRRSRVATASALSAEAVFRIWKLAQPEQVGERRWKNDMGWYPVKECPRHSFGRPRLPKDSLPRVFRLSYLLISNLRICRLSSQSPGRRCITNINLPQARHIPFGRFDIREAMCIYLVTCNGSLSICVTVFGVRSVPGPLRFQRNRHSRAFGHHKTSWPPRPRQWLAAPEAGQIRVTSLGVRSSVSPNVPTGAPILLPNSVKRRPTLATDNAVHTATTPFHFTFVALHAFLSCHMCCHDADFVVR